jgi:PAS domain S-box-containing protein
MRNDHGRGGLRPDRECSENPDAARTRDTPGTPFTLPRENSDSIPILLVEDDPYHAELISRAVRKRSPPHYSLVVAASLQEAKAALDCVSPTLIIADWNLPDGKGTEVLDWPTIVSAVPVVIITSSGNEQIAVDAIKKGALDFVVKSPAVFDEIVHIIERALREWEHMQQQVRAECSRRTNDDKFRELFNNVGEAIFLSRRPPEGLTAPFVEVNETACRWLRYSHEELVQMSIGDIAPEPYRELHKDKIMELPPDGSAIMKGELIRRDATRIPVELNIHTFFMDGEEMVLSIARDISERIEMERQQKATLAQIEKNLSQMAILNDQIRNPLTVIVGIADLLDSDKGKKIVDQAMQINSLVTLLDRSWIESEKIHTFLVKYHWFSDADDQPGWGK